MIACAEAAQKVEKSNEAVKEHLVEQEEVAHFQYDLKWLEPLKDLLLKIKQKVEVAKEHKQTALSVRQSNLFRKAYNQLIAQDLPHYYTHPHRLERLGQIRRQP